MKDLETRQAGDDELIDRLVDGELNDSERRALLEDFDRRSDGWRRCALAFLEAQTFGGVLREHLVSREPAAVPAPAEQPVVAPYVAPQPKANSDWGRILAAAASFLIACTAIMWFRSGLQPDAVAPLPNIAATMPTPPTEMVSLTVPGNTPGQQQTVQVPLVPSKSIDEAALRQQQPMLPQAVVKALELRGHQVQQQRQWIYGQLPDGRPAAIPVDQVELRYVGNKDFQ